MLHALKRKTVGIAAARNEPVNAEFENIRQSLANVSKALNAALSDVDSAEKSWNTLVSNSTHFSAGLHSLYPEEDDLREIFKKTLENLEGPLSKEMATLNDPTSKVRGIERMVRAYLTEIKTLTAEYHKVEKARKDYVMYQNKVDKLGQKEGQSDKQSRNLDKLEAAKATYHSILDGTIHRMKSTYEKAPTMFRAAYVSYWLYQSQMTALVQDHFKESFTIAKSNTDSLFSLSESSKSSGAPSK
eukprot:GFKZ01013524.1.p1 GENE.GFKZ01013524.1~~GFKZ01013524.1.p1  ORF type:complete len:244 (-),score=42.44 GFKZ01013524.1:630-1361(-)